MHDYEIQAEKRGYRCVSGVDEAGRGPLAGPVVAAAAVFPPKVQLDGLDDSKKLSPAKRDQLFPLIQKTSLGYGIGVVHADVIDRINILQASRLAMKLAVEKLPFSPDLLLIDGIHKIDSSMDQWTIIRGDSQSFSIAAASVLAKVTRDRIMEAYHRDYPRYEFHRHKGYGTRVHRERIQQYGPCPIHRRTFKGVYEYCPRNEKFAEKGKSPAEILIPVPPFHG
ncbi:MAG: ribonuclease HII [Nitrospinaceae bacterium]